MKKWFMNLSRASKIGLVSVVVIGLWVTGAVAQDATKPVKTTCTASEKLTEEVAPVAFEKTQIEDANLEKGKTAIRTTGIDGEKTTTSKITTYTPKNCKASATTLVKEEITKPAVAEVTAIGTMAPTPPPAPVSTYTPPGTTSSNCHPSYSPCVPNAGYDLDCPDIGMRVSVIGPDSYWLDADNDGTGCDSY